MVACRATAYRGRLDIRQLGELRRLRQGLKTSKLMMEVKKGAGVFLFHGDCYLLWMNERPTLK